MKIVTAEFQKIIEALINNLKIEDFPDSEEFNLARKYNALPLGFDFIACTFITSDGEVIDHDFQDDFEKSNDSQNLINALVYGKRRYPQLEKFIPNRSDDSKDCPWCKGSGKIKDANGKEIRCVICAGLGWITKETYETIQKNSE